MKNFLKRNKPLLFLPLILIPFIVLIFYILGGGKLPKEDAQNQMKKDSVKGANYSLPEADRNIGIVDKMESAQASKELTETRDYDILGEKDSLDSSSNFSDQELNSTENPNQNQSGQSAGLNADVSNNLLSHIRQREEQAREDLLKSQKETERDQEEEIKAQPKSGSIVANKTSESTLKPTGIEELDQIFRQNQQLIRKNDSLNQHLNEAIAKNEKAESEKSKHFTLEKQGKSGFSSKQTAVPAIEAEVYETATVLTGNRVKLRLMEDTWLLETKIPKNTFLYGTCEVTNERLQIEIRQIPLGEKFVPVEITVCDLDGLPGLYVPDNASKKVAKEVGSSANTSSMFGVSNNPLTYMGMQAADRTAQSLIKMIRIKKVTVKKNTLVYLINKSK
jgi:conjugative transposon TraM protein